MRQTSRAVALLLVLESAQAANTSVSVGATVQSAITNTNPSSIISNEGALIDRLSPYVSGAVSANISSATVTWTNISGNAAISMSKLAPTATALTDAVRINSQPCMSCLNNSGVWCSMSYSFLNTGTLTSAGTALLNANTPNSATLQITGTHDNGTCCGTNTNFRTWVGYTGQAAAMPTYTNGTSTSLQSGIAAGQPLTQGACIAAGVSSGGSLAGTAASKFGLSIWDIVSTNYTGWWCSNGLYKTITVAGSTTTATAVSNVLTTVPLNSNNRRELAQVACPQLSSNCGTVQVVDLTSNSSLPAAIERTKAISTYTFDSKCTWVAKSAKYAPTFTISKGATASSTGLVTPNWVIHHMEYTGKAATYSAVNGALTMSATTDGTQLATAAINNSNYVPLFNMPANQFATLRTWYGKGYTTEGTKVLGANTGPLAAEYTNWYAPYQQSAAIASVLTPIAGQYYGNVANFPSSSISAATPTASSSYGIASSAQFDVRVVRYFPAQIAQNVWATGSALSTLYAGKLTSYNTAKATWDAYVAILAKNAKTDAFAAAFSPPKAPTVPPLPNMPWAPAAYAGYLKQTPQQAAVQLGNTGAWASASQPTNQQFWTSITAAQSIGGWGSFTASLMKYREGYGKSFGTIGYSGDADSQNMSQVWNYKLMCNAATSTAAPTAACDASFVTTAANVTTVTTGQTAANDTAATDFNFVVVISLWSMGNTFSASGSEVFTANNSFNLQFKASGFSNTLQLLTDIAAPTAATAASSLTGLAGAQALAASTAAALAAAAALY